ncbi:AAA family ATPase [Bacillus taeanensis]|uniref:AAA family ATPase n=1 Tax=Bacillus taeanensis TaxID=273032 RepID=A0A366XU66_9BACI|nr:MoxR family ATPase [Bacillus taeanensis]RBW67684.1 AAA family ATPase [Bacillus taeanensis]
MTERNEEQLDIQDITERAALIKEELGKFIVGQKDVIDFILLSIFAGGHVLLEGLPGLGKTMLVRKISEVMALDFSRIQFTPDLMPTDITGTNIIQPGERGEQTFVFHKGPLFANIVLADEINRATPKTQSSLLEAMQEQTVTTMGEVKQLPKPFFVLATQNPIELEGTYPLPEAQMDRFLLKINVSYPTREELKEIVQKTTSSSNEQLEKVCDGAFIRAVQSQARDILLADSVLDYAVKLIMASHPDDENAPERVKTYVRYGSGPRGLQSLILTAKVKALLDGRYNVSTADLNDMVKPVLRHRIFLNFEGEASGILTDSLIDNIIEAVQKKEKVS